MKRHLLALTLLSLFNFVWPVAAQDLALSVVGEGRHIKLSLADLDAMPQESFNTTTIWTEGSDTFSGVPLSYVLNLAEHSGSVLRMVALNDYSVEMPIADIGDTYPIVATRMNGEPMKVRDKGPFWIIYPYGSDAKYQTETTYARSIWQLVTLSVKE